MSEKYKPKSIVILGRKYKITYHNNPANVDAEKRSSLWGQIDYWTRRIRIYDNGRDKVDIFETILHEILHGLANDLNLKSLDSQDKEKHNDLDRLAVALTDTLFRNGFLK